VQIKAHSQERPVDDRSSYRREVLEERGRKEQVRMEWRGKPRKK